MVFFIFMVVFSIPAIAHAMLFFIAFESFILFECSNEKARAMLVLFAICSIPYIRYKFNKDTP